MGKKKVAIVTGGSRGIGKAIAIELAKNNYDLAVFGRNIKFLDVTKELIKKHGAKCLVFSGDVCDDDFVMESVKQVFNIFQKVDVLVNNAGYGKFDLFVDSSLEEFKKMMDVNLFGVYRFTKQVVPKMIEQKNGTIINISSLAGKNSFVRGTMYASTKHALMGFSRSLMLELRKDNIKVAVVCPGSVDTEFFSTAGIEAASNNILTPQNVADSVMAILNLPPNALLSEVDIRPTNP